MGWGEEGEGKVQDIFYYMPLVYGLQGQSIEPGAAIRMTD